MACAFVSSIRQHLGDTMQIPPLLQEHIEVLENKGHKIEVTVNSEIHIVFKDYKIPGNVWNQNKTYLLVITHPTYPNAKIDMFWVSPPISLRSGRAAQGADTITPMLGKNWQQFSWHVSSWSPGTDNLITYLDVINARLRKDE